MVKEAKIALAKAKDKVVMYNVHNVSYFLLSNLQIPSKVCLEVITSKIE